MPRNFASFDAATPSPGLPTTNAVGTWVAIFFLFGPLNIGWQPVGFPFKTNDKAHPQKKSNPNAGQPHVAICGSSQPRAAVQKHDQIT